jgi:hypothetical protein
MPCPDFVVITLVANTSNPTLHTPMWVIIMFDVSSLKHGEVIWTEKLPAKTNLSVI